MTAMNTLRAIESLTQTGFSEEQARAVVGVVSEVVDDRTVTKQDFADLKRDFADLSRSVDARFTTFDSKLDARVASLESSIANAKVQMVLYTGGIVAGIAAVSRLFG